MVHLLLGAPKNPQRPLEGDYWWSKFPQIGGFETLLDKCDKPLPGAWLTALASSGLNVGVACGRRQARTCPAVGQGESKRGAEFAAADRCDSG